LSIHEQHGSPVGQPSWLRDSEGRLRLGWRLLLGWAIIVFGLWLAIMAGQLTRHWLDEPPWLLVQSVQALVTTTVIIGLICWLRLRGDRRSLAGIGLARPLRASGFFLLGFGMVATVIFVPLLIIWFAGWGTVTINTSSAMLAHVLTWLLIAFLFEAFPEEIAIRGYLYRNLNAVMARWMAALASIALFVAVPVGLYLFHSVLLGQTIDLDGGDQLTLAYLVGLVGFGLMLVLLRVLTGSVWTCVGFHLGFLQLARWLGDDEGAFIQIHAEPGAPVDPVFSLVFLAVLVGILLYPWISGHRPGWREKGEG
jgi:uncharacterized protein